MNSLSLSDYEQGIFDKLDSIKMYQWFTIQKERPDREELIETLKKYQDTWNMIEIRGDYEAFQKVWHPGTIEWAKQNNIKL